MIRRIRRGLTPVAAVAVLCIPATSGAVHSAKVAECTGTTAADGMGVCSTTFGFAGSGFVSNLETHAHFHQLVAELGPTKFVRLQWFDAAEQLVFSSFCQDRGLSTAGTTAVAMGLSDLQNVTCSSVYHRVRYAAGRQTLVVGAEATADPTPGDIFHGRLVISMKDSMV